MGACTPLSDAASDGLVLDDRLWGFDCRAAVALPDCSLADVKSLNPLHDPPREVAVFSMALWQLEYDVNISPARGPSVITQCVLSRLEGESLFGHSGVIGGRVGDSHIISLCLLESASLRGCTTALSSWQSL